ncbi:hypothetical protein [Massilia sp. 9096]|uniref:hypothetical protein n=1 Tax=Massilia sp. 9096 TaxID=1500894 RepID=UPI00055B9E2E|nr:hypothetical protein [Massilia sp. 9096]
MKKAFAFAALAAVVSGSVYAKPPKIPLKCAMSTGAVAERQYLDAASGGGNIYSILVTFTGKKPSNAKVETALRDCMAVATKLDGSKDVTASAWLKPHRGSPGSDADMLNPFGPMKFLVYTAATKKISLHVPQKG